MSRQSRGLQKEHELAKHVFEMTKGRVIPLRSGWSGNQAPPSPDLLIPFDGTLRAIELKTTSQDTLRIYEDDIEDIKWWASMMTEVPTYPYLSIKFNRWELCTVRLRRLSDWEKCAERFVEDCPLNARTTPSGNIAIDKPEGGNDYWRSVQTIDSKHPDADALLKRMEEEDTSQPSVSEIIREKEDYFENLGQH